MTSGAALLPDTSGQPLAVVPGPSREAETDVPAALAHALTMSPEKAAAYRRDPHFRAGALALRRGAAAGVPTGSEDGRWVGPLSKALVVLKPDAAAGRRAGAVLDALSDGGLTVVALAPFRFTPLLTRELWRYQFNIATQDRVDVVDLLLPAVDSLAVLLEDERWTPSAVPASCRLCDVKGAADPRARQPGDLRSRLGAPTALFNFIHTADEPADVLREVALLDTACGTALLPTAVSGPRSAPVRVEQVLDAIRRLEHQVPRHDLDATASGRRLLAREPFADLAPTRQGDPPPWRDVLVRCPDGRPAAHDLWDLLSVATAQIECNVAGLVPLLPTVRSSAWRQRRHG